MTKISLCMIVRNEGRYLEDCLNSVKDAVDEIIIVDTGSTDNTKEIAKKFNAKIIDFKWTGDFSQARNESLRHAAGEWILVLDADEVFDKDESGKIKELIKGDSNAYLFIVKNYSANQNLSGFVNSSGRIKGEAYKGWYASLVIRLFRNGEFKFAGMVHETVLPVKGKAKIAPSNIVIHHFGNLDPNVVAQKRQFYLELCKEKVRNNPDSSSYFELGVLYKENGKLEEAKSAFEKSVELDDKNGSSFYELGIINESKKKFEEAVKNFEKSASLKKSAETMHRIGVCYLNLGKLKEAHSALAKSLILNPKKYSTYNSFAAVLERAGNFKDAISALTIGISLNPNNPIAHFNLGVIYDKMNDFAKAIEHYRKAVALGHKNTEKIILRIEALDNADPDSSSFTYSFGAGED